MEASLKQIQASSTWTPVDSLTYRDITVNFYEDCLGHQVFAIWKDKVIEFGAHNTLYQEDMKLIIDDHLDTISRFSNNPLFYGAKLLYFQNGDHRDIKLVYKKRILKIYLTTVENDLTSIIEDAETLLARQVATEKN